MSDSPRREDRLDHRLALLLRLGTWAACAFISAGIVFNRGLVVAGVVILIALPVARVALMALWFAVHRELRFALAACVVFCIIVLSAILGAKLA